jgi:hypothetical protein
LTLQKSSRRALTSKCMGLLLIAILLLTPAFVYPDDERAWLPSVTAEGSQLFVEGQPFEVRGVNYIHPINADVERCALLHFGADTNCPWDMAAIESDMDRFAAHGVNTIRIFLNFYVFGGAREQDPNYSLDVPFEHLDALIEAANKRGIYVLPVLMAKFPQDRFGADQVEHILNLHVRPVVSHLAGNSGVIMWDLFNEPDIGSPVDIRCWDWDNADFELCFPLANERLHFLRAVSETVKAIDPHRLITISAAFAKSYFRPQGADLRMADLVDVYTFHYYDNDPYDSGRYAEHWYYGQGFPADLERSIRELHAIQLNKPVVVTEIGFPTGEGAMRPLSELQPELARARDVIRAEGTSGMMLWPFQIEPEILIQGLYYN